MLKIGSMLVLLTGVSVVNLRPCEHCEPSIDTAVGTEASVVKRMEPIESSNHEICEKIDFSHSHSRHSRATSCVTLGDDDLLYQTVKKTLRQIEIECKIESIETFENPTHVPVLNLSFKDFLNGAIKRQRVKRNIVYHLIEPKLVVQMRLDSANKRRTVIKAKIVGKDGTNPQISLKNDDLEMDPGQPLIIPDALQTAFDAAAKKIIERAVDEVLLSPMEDINTMLNCDDN